MSNATAHQVTHDEGRPSTDNPRHRREGYFDLNDRWHDSGEESNVLQLRG